MIKVSLINVILKYICILKKEKEIILKYALIVSAWQWKSWD